MKSYTKIVFFLVAVLFSFSSNAKNWYVNDNSVSGDIYCSVIGKSTNTGLVPSSPLLTLSSVLSLVSNGDVIYIDNGSYSDYLLTISKSVTIIGAGISNTIFSTNKARYFASLNVSNIVIKNLSFINYGGQDLGKGQVIDVNGGQGILFENISISGSNGSGSSVLSNINIVSNSNVTIKNLFFKCSGFNAPYGGGVSVNNSTLYVINSIFFNTDNLNSKGGAIDVQGGSNVFITDCTFDTNTATDGGAIGIQNTSNVTITGSCFLGNKSEGTSPFKENGGGAIFTKTSGIVNITDCSFSNNCTGIGVNTLPSGGGAIDIVTCAGPGNDPQGGAIRQISGTLNLTRVSFANNSSAKKNSAMDIHKEGGTLNLLDVTFNTISTGSNNNVNIVNTSGALSFNNSGQPVSDGSGISILKPEVSGSVAPTIVNITPPSVSAVTNCISSVSIVSCASTIKCATETASPIILKCVNNKTLTDCSPLLNYTPEVSAYDNCSFTVSQYPPAGASLSNGANLVTMTVSDGKNAPVTCTFTVTATGCSSLVPPLPPTTTKAIQNFCSASIPAKTLADILMTGTTIKWYTAATAGSILPSTTVLVNNTKYYASQTNAGGLESTSRTEVTVYVLDPPTLTITTPAAVCSPTTVDITSSSVISTNGTTLSYWSDNLATTAITNQTAITASNTYYIKSENDACSVIKPVVVTINTPPTLTIATPAAVCSPTTVDITSSSVISTTGTTLTYWSDITALTPITNQTAITASNTYYIKSYDGKCSTIKPVTVTINTPPTLTITNPEPVCSPTKVDLTITYVVSPSGTTITYWSDITATTPILTPTTISTLGIYYIKSDDGKCSIVKPVDVAIGNPPAPTLTTSTDAHQVFCASSSPTVADLKATYTGIIKWYDKDPGGTALVPSVKLRNGDYYATQTEIISGCESTSRLTVTVELTDPAKPTSTSTDATQSFCASKLPTIANLVANATGTLKWYEQAVPNNTALLSTTALVDGKHYYATQTTGSPACESTSTLDVLVNITADPLAPTGSLSQSFCSSTSHKVSDLKTSTGTNVLWYANNSGGLALASTTDLIDGNHYFATQTTTALPGCESTTRFDVTITVTATLIIPTGDSPQNFCTASNPTVADLKTNSGSNILWYATSTGGSHLLSTDIVEDSKHYYAAVSGCENPIRLDVEVFIKATPPPLTTVATQDFCAIDTKKVSDLVSSGLLMGATILWYNPVISGSTTLNPTTAIVSGTYYATQKDGICESSRSIAVTVTVNDPAKPTTLSATQDFCAIDAKKVSDLSATILPGANISWYNPITSGSTTLNSTTALVSGTYYATQIVGSCESDERLEVTVNVSDPAKPTTTSTSQSFCAIDTKKVSNLSATVLPGATILWYNLAISGSTTLNPTTALVSGTYYATQTVGSCESDERLEVTVNVSDPAKPITTNASQSFCSIDTKKVSDLSAIVLPGATILWYNPTISGSTALNPTTALVSGTYYATQKVGSCESDERLEVTVTVNNPAKPTTTNASQSFCTIDTKKVSDLSATVLPGATILWYNPAISGSTTLNPTTALVSGTYYATQKVGSCESDTRLSVTVDISDPDRPTTTKTSQSFCTIDTKKVSDLSATVLPGATILWYNTAISGSTTLNPTTALVSGTYYATQKVGSCESDTRLSVFVTVNDPSAPTTTNTSQSFCLIDTKKVSDLSASGSSLIWYDAPTSGTAYATNATLVSGTYYATQKVGLCESKNRLAIDVKISNPAIPSVNNVINPTCLNIEGMVEFTNLPSIGNWTLIATPTIGSAINVSSTGQTFTMKGLTPSSVYKFTVKDNTSNCSSDQTGSISIGSALLSSDVPTGKFKQYFCLSATPKISDLDANGTMINWYNALNGGTSFLPTDALTDKMHYFATQTKIGECESTLRFEVIVNLSNISLAIDSHVKSHCGKSDGIVTVVAKDGIGTYDYSWDNQQSTTNILSNIGVGQFVANVKDSVGCKSTISVEQLCESTIPQIITANGNGKNDTWVLNLDTKSNLKIFNRWGSLVFMASPYMDDWSGQTNEGATIGKGFLPSGTYFYTIDKLDGEKPVSGFIELIR